MQRRGPRAAVGGVRGDDAFEAGVPEKVSLIVWSPSARLIDAAGLFAKAALLKLDPVVSPSTSVIVPSTVPSASEAVTVTPGSGVLASTLRS